MGKWWEKKQEVVTVWQACKTPDGLDYYFNTVSNETSWEKPDELMTDEEKDAAGDWQWVPDENHAFVPGKKMREEGKSSFCKMEDGQERKVLTSLLQPLKKSAMQRVPDDLVLLDSMTGPLILHCLKERFMQDKIYTNVGTIVISVNPYQRLPLYSRDIVEKYMMRGTKEMPPHVFNIGHNAFKGMKEFGQNQSVIISGESGAGKTEATKQVLNYIAAIAGSVGGVEKKVLQANPILEGFGNAKTIRNDNSSRFGKYMEIFFADDGRICGAVTTNYLLEKIRVCQQAPNERNYHVFYQLVKAASAAQKTKFGLGPVDSYKYLTLGNCTNVDNIDDVADFKELGEAFDTLLFTQENKDNIYSAVAGILHLGNIEFKAQGSKMKIGNPQEEEHAAKCLGIPGATLSKALTVRTLRIRGQPPMDVPLKDNEASDTRHALAKFIYGGMFNWLVTMVNKAMATGGKMNKSIGCLDIFGFEIFKHNSFEQLCINFTNEMLQQHFNNQTFKLEEAIYRAERIKFATVAFIDNVPMIELITKKPIGILPLLDEELVVPKGSDKTFVAKLHQLQGKNKVYKLVRKNPDHFIVKHYAGEVEYNTEGFCEKNRDTLTEDLMEAVQQSTLPMMQAVFPVGNSTRDKKSSLSKQFQLQLTQLMATLNKTEPHYVRCVKPNQIKAAQTFDPKPCFDQLLFSGVFEAVSIRKQGFPFRLKHDVFAKRYECISKSGSVSKDKSGCQQICKDLNMDNDHVQTGTTLMLYRAEEHKKLELDRSIKVMTKEINEKLEKITRENPGSDKDEYFDRLAMAVRQADEFRLKSPVAEKARKMLDEYIEARMDPETKRMLIEAERTQDKALLEKALSQAALHGYRTSLTRKCSELLEQVSDAEEALTASINNVDKDMLEQCMTMCGEFNYTGGQMPAGKQLLADIVRTNSELENGKASKDHVTLEAALRTADSIRLNSMLVQEARALLKKIQDARQQLESAIGQVDQYQMEAALAVADGFSYDSDLVHQTRALCARCTRINQETEKANGTMEEDHIRVCVKAGQEINMHTQWLDYFANLVNGDHDAFLEAQYNKAVENGNAERAIRLAIKRKDLLVQGKGGQFVMGQFQKLKQPTAWGNEKMFGKEKRALTFLKWQKEIIHSPLVNHNIADKLKRKDVHKTTRVCHETVMKFMGQKKSKKLGIRVSELLGHGIRLPEIRSEIYIHILKQITENTADDASAAIPKAWDLMALCLSQFPPGPDFENYLEVQFRDSTHKVSADRWKCCGLIRRIVYHGAASSPLDMGTCDNAAGYLNGKMAGFDDPPPPNTYDDLKQPYSGGGGGGGGYQQPAAAAYQAPAAAAYQAPAAAAPEAAAPAAAAPAAADSPWGPILDEESGDYYYYNSVTGESTWDKPAELM